MVRRAGTGLLTDLADATGLAVAMSDALAPLRQRASGHDPGRVAMDVAVMLADGGEATSDLAVLRGQPDLVLDATGEATGRHSSPGNAGSNTTADHIEVLDLALAQLPDAHRHGTEVLVRSDSAGATKGFLAHIRSLRENGVRSFFSVGVAITEPIRAAIATCVDWQAAIESDASIRDGDDIAEITYLVDMSAYPQDTRMIVRRERTHPGAQLSLFDAIE